VGDSAGFRTELTPTLLLGLAGVSLLNDELVEGDHIDGGEWIFTTSESMWADSMSMRTSFLEGVCW